MTHVIDTCAFLDLLAGRWENASAKKVLKSAEAPVLLSVSAWEIARKVRIGKLKLPCSQAGLHDFLMESSRHFELRWVDLSTEICHASELLPPLHDDPFDRMILALASLHAVPVFTSDAGFEAYPVQIIRHR